MEDESCRILTVSSTIEVAVAFIESESVGLHDVDGEVDT
jgi:hypothetical protein